MTPQIEGYDTAVSVVMSELGFWGWEDERMVGCGFVCWFANREIGCREGHSLKLRA
jgi:hypothetical protein